MELRYTLKKKQLLMPEKRLVGKLIEYNADKRTNRIDMVISCDVFHFRFNPHT